MVEQQPPAPEVTARRALRDLAGVALVLGGWYLLYTRTGLGERVHARSPAAAIAVQVSVNAILSLFVVALALRASRQRWADIGLGRDAMRGMLRWGLLGVVGMYVAQALLMAVLTAFDVVVASWGFDVTNHLEEKRLLAEQFAVLPSSWVLPVALLVGFYEEILFRGLVLSRVLVLVGSGLHAPHATRAQRLRLVAAALSTACLFAAGHVYQGPLGIAQTFVAGLVLTALVVFRRSLWPAIFAHATIDLVGLVAARLLLPFLRDQLPTPP